MPKGKSNPSGYQAQKLIDFNVSDAIMQQVGVEKLPKAKSTTVKRALPSRKR